MARRYPGVISFSDDTWHVLLQMLTLPTILTLGRVAAIPALIAGELFYWEPLFINLHRHILVIRHVCKPKHCGGWFSELDVDSALQYSHCSRADLVTSCFTCAAWFWQDPAASTVVTALFIVASITDWLDGYLARKMVRARVHGRAPVCSFWQQQHTPAYVPSTLA